jgi:holo-[acyl-carrier protein] synthase
VIFGIGTDIVKVERMQQILDRHGERFAERLLMPEEELAFQGNARPARYLAMRFAAKEAIVKAMGTGFAHGMCMRDTGIVSNARGRPQIVWSARGREVCEQLGIGEGHITLTDEAGLVVAMAVLMKK